MLNVLVKGRGWLIKGLEWAIILIMAVLVLDVVTGVVARYIFNSPIKWTGELAQFLLIWISLAGASLTFERKGHLGVDYFVGKLNAKAKKIAEVFAYLVIAAFAGSVIFYGGLMLVINKINFPEESPALGLQWWIVYMVIPISGLFIVLFSMEVIVKDLMELPGKKKEEEKPAPIGS